MKNPGDTYLAVAYSDSVGKPQMFFNPANNQGIVKTTRQALRERGEDPRNADVFLNANSDYDVERFVVYATPAQLSLAFQRKKAVWAATFLMIKQTKLLGSETGLYSFQTGHLHGFQIGEPSRARNVRVDAFDGDDREFEFVFSCKPGPDYSSKQGFTQRNINKVLQTLRPVPGSQQ